jgi:nucleoside-diphosphate-sugar epimerase
MATGVAQHVVVTGADGQVGRALLARLRSAGIRRTVALTRRPCEVPAWMQGVGELHWPPAMSALAEAELIVHLAGAMRPRERDDYVTANVRTAEAVARAAAEGNAKRVLFLSQVGVHEAAHNRYLQSKAEAERILEASGKELVVFRCTPIYGGPEAPGPAVTPMLRRAGGAAWVLGNGRQLLAPVYLQDVVTALIAALQGGRCGTYELAGPEVMPLDAWVRVVNRSPALRIRHVPALLARLLGRVAPDLTGAMADLLLRDSTGDSTAACAAFGLRLTPLSAVWR